MTLPYRDIVRPIPAMADERGETGVEARQAMPYLRPR